MVALKSLSPGAHFTAFPLPHYHLRVLSFYSMPQLFFHVPHRCSLLFQTWIRVRPTGERHRRSFCPSGTGGSHNQTESAPDRRRSSIARSEASREKAVPSKGGRMQSYEFGFAFLGTAPRRT